MERSNTAVRATADFRANDNARRARIWRKSTRRRSCRTGSLSSRGRGSSTAAEDGASASSRGGGTDNTDMFSTLASRPDKNLGPTSRPSYAERRRSGSGNPDAVLLRHSGTDRREMTPTAGSILPTERPADRMIRVTSGTPVGLARRASSPGSMGLVRARLLLGSPPSGGWRPSGRPCLHRTPFFSRTNIQSYEHLVARSSSRTGSCGRAGRPTRAADVARSQDVEVEGRGEDAQHAAS